MTQLEGRDAVDLSDIEFWVRPTAEREAAFARLRKTEPIKFFEEPQPESFPRGPGYWALTRHHDVVEASRQPELSPRPASRGSIQRYKATRRH